MASLKSRNSPTDSVREPEFLLEAFRVVFNAQSFPLFVELMTGWVLSHRHRFVTDLIVSSGSVGNPPCKHIVLEFANIHDSKIHKTQKLRYVGFRRQWTATVESTVLWPTFLWRSASFPFRPTSRLRFGDLCHEQIKRNALVTGFFRVKRVLTHLTFTHMLHDVTSELVSVERCSEPETYQEGNRSSWSRNLPSVVAETETYRSFHFGLRNARSVLTRLLRPIRFEGRFWC